MSKRNKIAQCEQFFKALVKQKDTAYTELYFGSFTRNRGYIDGLEWCIEKLGKILDMAEDDPYVEMY